ncbi:MAG: ABC-2 transporter permease [Peptostreptococcaceae bacterium]|nr:ABC-2 transporter permease [Peptostreptococcaceae bacterium]
MINLLIKDFMLLRKNLWILIVYSFMIFFIFSKTDTTPQMIYVMGITMISYILLMYSSAYDDLNKSDMMLNSLPLKRRDIVAERYLSLFVFIASTAIIMSLSGLIMISIGIVNNLRLVRLDDVAIATCSVCFIVFLYLPVYFKLGSIKAKLFNFAIIFLVFMIPTFLSKVFLNGNTPTFLENLKYVTEIQAILFMGITVTLLGIASFMLSNRFYNKREF